MIEPKDILWYFAQEIEGLKESDLTCTIDGEEVIIKPVHWLDDGWSEIMDYVYAMDGEWHSEGKNSNWIFPLDRITDRIEDLKLHEKNKDLLDWVDKLSKEDQDRLREEVRTGASTDETLGQKWDRVRTIRASWCL